MPKFPSGGKITVSLTQPSLNVNKNPVETEVKYYGLVRDEALFDIEKPEEALDEVLRDVQDPAEASTEGIFAQQDIEIIDGVVRYNLKNEDFSVLENASLNTTDDNGTTTSLVNPRQRVADRIKQLEFFAGRGTLYQGQGTTLFKYIVPTTAKDSSDKLYSHTNPPPFFTKAIDSTDENAPDFIPSTETQIQNTHRVGYLSNGIFVPAQENEYWWSGEYNFDGRDRDEYGSRTRDSLSDPKYPIVKDGNLSFDAVSISGISTPYNWGLRFDTWFKKNRIRDYGRFAAQVNGHLRIDFFEKTGYDSAGKVTGSWKTALDTTNTSTYFIQETKEKSVSNSKYGYRRYFIQGGPTTNYGAGTGTKPDYATRAGTGGVFDYTQTYIDREDNLTNRFGNEYVPVVIRFWYGQKDPSSVTSTSSAEDILKAEPAGPASIVLDHIVADGYENWNDYSSIVKFTWSNTNSAWVVADGNETDLTNFNDVFEVFAYKQTATNPDGTGSFDKDNWDLPTTYVGGSRKDSTTNQATFSIPGFSPGDNDPIWVVIRNRPWSGIPYTYDVDELWQRYLFDPAHSGTYETAADMIEGGSNYIQPDPLKLTFDENFDFYKSKFGQLPTLNTYGPDRYDGMIRNEVTTQAGSKDYDYNHPKSLFIGRQKKGSVSEIGDGFTDNQQITVNDLGSGTGNTITSTSLFPNVSLRYIDRKIEFLTGDGGTVSDTRYITSYDSSTKTVTFSGALKTSGSYYANVQNLPKIGKNLATGETRSKGENYTFINVISDSFGDGGNIVINAFPANSMGILRAGDTESFDKALHLADNSKTYSNADRQNIQNLSLKSEPNTGFDSTAVCKIQNGTDGLKYIYSTSVDGNTYDQTGVFSSSAMGNGTTRDHDIKTAFLVGFKLSNGSDTGAEYSFYGLIGAIRPSQKNISLTTSSTANQISSSTIFPNIIGGNSYLGTIIEFKDGSGGSVTATGKVTAYDNSTNTVTLTMSSGTITTSTAYFVDIWYNYLVLPSLPTNVVNSTGGKVIASSVISDGTKFKIYYVYNGSYQYSRVDNGSGLSFSETLFIIGDDSSTTEAAPFQSGTETPAPPAEIVTPFGYDNAVTAGDPGLGGLCYPPYTSQSIDLISTIKSTTQLAAEAEGKFDVWWGSRDSLSDLGSKYLEVTDKLIFDFDSTQRASLLSTLTTAQKPDFIGATTTPYTHKLEVELNVDIPAGTTNNPYLYKDAQNYSNNKPVKDLYFLFIKKNGSDLEVLTANNPSWT